VEKSSAKYQGPGLAEHMVVLNKQNFRAHVSFIAEYGDFSTVVKALTRQYEVNLVISPYTTFKQNVTL
jgi:hypothetical protein